MHRLLPLRWLALALILLLAWDASHLDLTVMRWVGDAHGFALREAWATRVLIHEGGRLVSYVAMGFIVLLNLWPRLLPGLSVRERRWWLLTTLACLAVVSLVKRASLTSCPWDLAEFGGEAAARYVSHWAFGVRDGGGGHCFPSGHASAAFAYLAGAWALARAYPRSALAWGLAVVGLGIVYGVGQMVRGAHYPSHTMWTAWICWAVTVAAARLGPWRLARPAAA
ncbi:MULTISPECIES: phosphatase PAP2 family protein [Roseateles]|uniref:Phosphatase PAP2 family protein n=1 Tax=Pelomonas caseinilytica TaxID=2906763 RepID=A0ABS8XJV7_9BURK|nr:MULTISPECIES: phosphatase PAP2 family protein [unclassified Roseateles]MCE4538844.1 phosphatase PAP2 family protein [Pelomonas sp. P7]HEV6965570.1 phosphatase PAP2 family protein [Roseateles sp.]